jgi:hypothetical protein
MCSKVFLAMAVGLALSACAGAGDKGAALSSRFVGQPFDTFVTRYGIPQGSQKLANGKTVYEWSSHFGVANTGAPIQTLLMAGSNAQVQGGSYQLECKVRLIVGPSGMIEQFAVADDTIGAWQLSRCNEVFAN